MNRPFFRECLAKAFPFIFLVGLLANGSAVLWGSEGCRQSRKDTYFLFSLARVYFNQGDFEKSEELLREAAIIDDCSASLYAESAEMLLKMGKDRAADQFASVALKIDPDETGALEILVMTKAGQAIATRDGEMLEKSLELCREAIRKDPRKPRLRFILVKLYLEKDDFERAGQSLKEYMIEFPQDSEPLFLAAEVLSRADRQGSAEKVASLLMEGDAVDHSETGRIADLLEGEKDLNAAHLLYQGFLKERPDRRILLRDAAILYALGEYEKISAMLEQGDLGSDDSADELRLKARVQSRTGKMRDAIENYEKLLALEQGKEDTMIELGELFERTGDIRNAILYYRSAVDATAANDLGLEKRLFLLLRMAALSIELDDTGSALEILSEARRYGAEKDLIYHIILSEAAERKSSRAALKIIEKGKILFQNDRGLLYREAEVLSRRKPKEAEKLLMKIVESENWVKESCVRASRIFYRSGDLERAWTWIKQGLEKYPDSDMHLEAGSLMERWGKYQDAERYLKKAIELDATNATALNYLGYMLAVRGEKLEEALAYVEKALELEKYNGAFIDSLGYIYLRMGKVENAGKYLVQASEIFPRDPEIWDHLGDLHHATGKTKEALGEWKKAIEYGIESVDAVMAKIKQTESELKAPELHAAPPMMGSIDSVKMTASFRGKLSFGQEKIRFRGVMVIDGARGRLEFMSPLGKTGAVIILSDGIISFFLPDSRMLYSGRSNAENLFKVFGVRMEPAVILNLLTGLEQKREGLDEARPSFRFVSDGSEGRISIESTYRKWKTDCGSFIPEGIAAYDEAGFPIVEIIFASIMDLEVRADGRLFCTSHGTGQETVDVQKILEDETFSDRSFRELAGIEIVELDGIKVAVPIILEINGDE